MTGPLAAPGTVHSVMFIGAHPDDETVMAGGTLALLAELGIATHVVCATDGRGGESGGVIEAADPAGRARVREMELRCATEALGVTSLTLLGYEDPVIGAGDKLFPFRVNEEILVSQLADLIRHTRVSVVLTHGSNGEYGHPAHIQLHRATLRAIREHAPGVIAYSIAARVPTLDDRLWNQDDPADLALDITPWIDAKHAAMLCHRTQHQLFKRRRRLKTVREAIRTVESFHRHWPATGSPPDDAFAALILAEGGWRPDHTAQSASPQN